MAAYADFAYYSGVYLGAAIAIADFPRLALRASAVIDQVTFGRAAAIVTAATDTATIELIKHAACAVADELATQETGGGNVVSERVGSHSVTYATPIGSAQARLIGAARRYLGASGLMYKGFNEDE